MYLDTLEPPTPDTFESGQTLKNGHIYRTFNSKLTSDIYRPSLSEHDLIFCTEFPRYNRQWVWYYVLSRDHIKVQNKNG